MLTMLTRLRTNCKVNIVHFLSHINIFLVYKQCKKSADSVADSVLYYMNFFYANELNMQELHTPNL